MQDVEIAAVAAEAGSAGVNSLLAVRLEHDPVGLGPLLRKCARPLDRIAGQALLIAAVEVRAIELAHSGAVELSREHFAVARPRRRLAKCVAVLVDRERSSEVGADQ